MTRSALVSLLAAVLLGVAGPALAQQDLDAAARAHFQSGTAYFETGDYESALREFQRAYDMSQRPALLYNIYLAQERLNQLAPAADALERYLAAVPDDPRHGTLALRLENIRRRIAEQQTTGAATGTGTGTGAATATGTGAATGTGTATGTGAGPSIPEEPPSSGPPLGAIIAFSAGGAGLVTFGIFGALALSEDSSLASSCGADAGRTCTDDQVSTLKTYSLVADLGLTVGVIGAALGAVLLFTAGGDDHAEARPTARITPWLGSTVAGIAASGEL